MLGEGIFAVAAQGFILGAGLCCTLGPQSVYVLRQGVRRQDALAVATICTITDIIMIAVGVAGSGAILLSMPHLEQFTGWSVACLAFAFGVRALQGVLWPSTRLSIHRPEHSWGVVAMALALSLLNPQVYLEMMAFVGGVAIHYPERVRIPFALGVMIVSPLWFFGLAFVGRALAHRMGCGCALRLFDGLTAVIMIGLAALLVIRRLAV